MTGPRSMSWSSSEVDGGAGRWVSLMTRRSESDAPSSRKAASTAASEMPLSSALPASVSCASVSNYVLSILRHLPLRHLRPALPLILLRTHCAGVVHHLLHLRILLLLHLLLHHLRILLVARHSLRTHLVHLMLVHAGLCRLRLSRPHHLRVVATRALSHRPAHLRSRGVRAALAHAGLLRLPLWRASHL